MEVKDAVLTLEKSEVFKKFKKDYPNAYLANLFSMMEPNNPKPEWHIGYYDKEKEKIVTFILSDEIIQNPESEVFRDGGHVTPVDLSKIKISLIDALQNAISHQKQKYPVDTPTKKIIVVQHIDGHYLYNMTFVTQTFKTLNIKVSTQDGRIVSSKLYSIFDFDKKD